MQCGKSNLHHPRRLVCDDDLKLQDISALELRRLVHFVDGYRWNLCDECSIMQLSSSPLRWWHKQFHRCLKELKLTTFLGVQVGPDPPTLPPLLILLPLLLPLLLRPLLPSPLRHQDKPLVHNAL